MILSMTGFGTAERHHDGVSYRVEIRSVNNRYFKAAIKLPDELACFETEVESRLRSRLGRGSLAYSLLVKDQSLAAAAEVNVAVLQAYLDQLRCARADGVQLTIDLSVLLTMPGVCQARSIDAETLARYGGLVAELTDQAIDRLLEMRRTEGSALRTDLLSHSDRLKKLLSVVRERGPKVVEVYHQKLRARVNSLLAAGNLALDQDDLIREVAVFAERCDVSEEIARLLSHVEQFERLCDQGEESGRKLDFLTQEMLREANTIGSKANDATIARDIVDTKAVIDRMKEQVQNVA